MNKRIFLLVAAVIALSVSVFAGEWTDPDTGMTWSYRIIDDYAELYSGGVSSSTSAIDRRTSGIVEIPSVLGGKIVRSIGEAALYMCGKMSSVIIPDCVTNIGSYAFSWCDGLTSIRMPNNVISVGNGAFSYCFHLQSVGFSDNLLEIGHSAFEECKQLSSVSFSDSITNIGYGAFWNCTKLESVKLPASLSKISEVLFVNCTNLTSITIPDNVTKIEGSAFMQCLSLSSVSLGKNLREICDQAFLSCYSLTSIVVPESVVVIDWAFQSCNGLKYIYLAGQGRSVDFRCIAPSTTKLYVAPGSTNWNFSIPGEVAGCAVDYCCHPAKSVVGRLSPTCCEIGYEKIYRCDFCDAVLREGAIPALGHTAEYNVVIVASTLYPPGLRSYRCKRCAKEIKGERAKLIGGGCLVYCVCENGIELVTWDCGENANIPLEIDGINVRSIAGSAFENNVQLVSVMFPDTLEDIGSKAFANDFCLDDVVIPDSVEAIGDGAFSNCTEMASISFGSGLKHVGNGAFYNCISLESVVFQDGLTNIGTRTFYGPSRLKSVSLPASLEYIGGEVFKGSAYITGVTVPTHLKTMQELFPDSYQRIESVVIPEGEGVIIDSMFAGCKALKSIVIPVSVTNIGASAFANCEALEELGLPDEVSTLGARAFYRCLKLKTVSLPRKLTAIANETFSGCSQLDSLVVPAAVKTLGSSIYSGLWYYPYTAKLTGVYFFGDAPEVQSNTYQGMPNALTSYVVKGSTGWYIVGAPTLPPDGWPTSGNTRSITYWTPNEFEVTFNGNGGTPDTYVAKQITDTTYSLPKSNPTRSGYLFEGWWTEKTAGAQVYWNSRVTATKAHTLYAHWKALSDGITVIFNPNGGTVDPAEMTYPAGVTYGDFPVPTRIGYRFIGWYTSHVGGDLVDEATEVSKVNNELYAHWTPITYTVAFNANGGSGTMHGQTHTYNEPQALTANAYYLNGFKFTGWSETAGGTVKYANNAIVENLAEVQGQVVTLYAVWNGANYAVRFDGNGGAGIMENQTLSVGVRQALAQCTFTRTGYAFSGWATTAKGVVEYADCEEVLNLTLTSGSTVPLFAVWSPILYGIVYNANGGTGKMASQNVFYDKEVEISDCGFVLSGCTFAGWATEPDGDVVYTAGQKVTNLSAMSGGIVTLYAVWNGTPPVVPPGPVSEYASALDEAKLAQFETDVAANWTVVTCNDCKTGTTCVRGTLDETYDEVGTDTTLSASVKGPGTLTFWWKVSCDADPAGDFTWDRANFFVDGTVIAQIDGSTDWRQVSYSIAGEGEHKIAWSYSTDGYPSETVGLEDSVWIDGVSWSGEAVEDPLQPLVDPIVSPADGMSFSTESCTVSISCATPDAVIYYSTNGRTPATTDANRYTGPFEITKTTTIKAVAVRGEEKSSYVTAIITKEVVASYDIAYEANGGSGAMPLQSCAYGVSAKLAMCTFERSGYSFAGWATNSTGEIVYADGATVTNLTTVADATVTLYAVWKYLPLVDPVIEPTDGAEFKTANCTVSITCASADAVIYYSTNGRTPATTESNRYKGAFAITATTTIKAVAIRGEEKSAYVTATITKTVSTELVDASVGKDVTGLDDPVVVPATWVTETLVQRFGSGKADIFRQQFGNDFAVALGTPTGKVGPRGETRTVWDDYVAGTDPTDPKSVFATTIEIIDGKVVLNWSPNLNLGSTNRLYRVKSKNDLADEWSCPPVSGHRFFTTEVALPDGKTKTFSPGAIVTASSENGSILYCVIDLSGGTQAKSYPMSYLSAVPSGEWSDEYKTTKLVLRRIEAGSFVMGEDQTDMSHRVVLTRPFYMGVFEVTQRQWELVMGNRPSGFSSDDGYASRPVERVSYDDMRGSSDGSGWPASSAVDSGSFFGVLQQKTGLDFDLPTEAQWEYACRAGTTTDLNSGKNLVNKSGEDANMNEVGLYAGNAGSGTAKVGSYQPNAWGLYDMHGNVFESCLDWHGTLSYGEDPKGAASGSCRVLRGGCFTFNADGCTSHYRGISMSDFCDNNRGFRISLTLSK